MTESQHHRILQDRLQKAIDMHRAGRFDEAFAEYAALLQDLPGNPQLLCNLGIIKFSNYDEAGEAITLLRAALDSDPEYVDALYNLGRIYQGFDENARAIGYYERLLEVNPKHSKALNNLGVAKASIGSTHEARALYERAQESNPENENSLVNQSLLESREGNDHFATELADKAVSEFDPDAVSHFHLGNQKKDAYEYQEAALCYLKALELDPSIAYAKGYLAFCLAHACFWEGLPQLLDEIKADIEFEKRVIDPFSSVVLIHDSDVQKKVASIFTEDRFAESSNPLWTGEVYSHERIRVGYLSADYHEHATSYLMAELFESHDKDHFETYAISFGRHSDGAMRQRLVNAFDHFIDVNDQTDREVAEMMRELEIDIAIDLKGYTADARPGILSHRPCPVQAQYLGFPGTMGAPYIDYIIADDVIIPESHEQYYTEKVIRLPGCYQPCDSKQKIADRIPTRAEEGLPEDAYVYCCFNNNYKITPEIFDVWMEILKDVPDSVLWLYEGNATAPVNLRKEAEKRGVDPGRLIFAKKKPIEEHLARHQLADLFLDTIPCNAHTTARDALQAGLPVLTMMGDTFASRVAASIGQTAGGGVYLAETIADYKACALRKPALEFTINIHSEFSQNFMNTIEKLTANKGSCLKQEKQELSSVRFQDSTNTSTDSVEHTGSRSLLKKQRNECSNAATQVLYPSEANAASLVTLFCAVYHRDKNRHALIEEHLENIKSQSLPVEPIYVFEAGDQPSSAAKPYSIVSPSRLSIYQAWHMAMEQSNKKLLINLNLDDRLCPDAVARMSSYFESDDVMLVGGEWMIASQVAKPDQIRNISMRETYFDPAWPPKKCSFTRSGENLRLGSGTGERGTYGPATMFRRSLLEELQYPLKFGNGELVESIADSLWWSSIKRKYPGGAIRIPKIVGIYHSAPSSQAEFRVMNEWEKLQKWGLM